MNKNTALKAAGGMFLLISLAQLSRVIFRFHILVEGWELPVWPNVIAFFVFLPLSIWMFRAASK